MRIGIEAQRIFREKKHGMDFVALELIKNLPRESSHEFFVFVNAHEHDLVREQLPNVTLVSHKTSYPIWEQVWLPKKVAELKLDILHCTANTFPVFCKVPIVLTLHDIIFMEKHPLIENDFTWYQRLGNLYRRLLVKNFIGKLRDIVTVSKFEEKNITNSLPQLVSTRTIYNGVCDQFNPSVLSEEDVEHLRAKYSLPRNFFLFLGNTDPKKNTRKTLKAFAEFQKGHISANLVVGDLNEKYIRSCLKDEEYKGARAHIHAVGYIDHQDLPGLIKMSQAFIYTSLRESFGIPLLEGMACGIPVLTSNTSSMPEIAQNAALLVDPNNIHQMSNAMTQLWMDDRCKEHFAERGVHRSSLFQWKAMAEQYVELYENVA